MSDKIVVCAECGKPLEPHPLGKIIELWEGVYQPCPDHPKAKIKELEREEVMPQK